jgi:hypothetical protein
MRLHGSEGVRVYVDAHDAAVLVAYKRLRRRYLLLVYTRHRPWYGVVSFDALLDLVPVLSVPVRGVDLSLEPTVEATVHVWLARIHAALV